MRNECLYCGDPFPPRKNKRFCSGSCRVKYWKSKHEINIPDLIERIEKIEKHLGISS